MHKRRPHARGGEFFATCLIWGLIVFVLIQLATYSPRTYTLESLTAPAAEAAVAAAVEHAAAAVSHKPDKQIATSDSAANKDTGQQSSLYLLSPSKHLALGPETYTGSPLVVITTTTAPYIDWTLNWSAHLKRLAVNHAVVALDPSTVAALTGKDGIPAVLDASVDAQRLGLMTHQTVRREYAHLRTLGYLRVGLPFHLMQQYRWQAMVLSDADVIWLRHPSELLQVYPDAELLVSTDCLSVKAVVERRPEVYRCGMQPGGWNSAWNTGVVAVRDTPAATAAMSAWRDAMAPGSPSKSVEGWWVDDQLALTQLLDTDSMPYQGINGTFLQHKTDSAASGSSSSSSSSSSHSSHSSSGSSNNNHRNSSSNSSFRSPTILAMKRQLKVVALSPLDIAGGHVAFHQRLSEAYNVTPFGVHYTFQTKFDNAGKLSRARESNFWLRDPAEPAGSRYLTYQNTVEAWLAGMDVVWKQHIGRNMVDLQKHVLAAGYQLQVFAEALAAAQVLNRTLVPPRMVCYCTQDPVAWTDSLDTCAVAGSDKLPPFECTMENLINVVELQRSHEHMLRTPDFFIRREVQQLVNGSRTGVSWVRSLQETGRSEDDLYAAQLLAAMQAKAVGSAESRPKLPLRVSESQLRGLMVAHAGTVVVDFGLLAPGWFAGLESPELASRVRQAVADMTMYVGWCCLLDGEEGQNMEHAYVNYQPPTVPLTERAVQQWARPLPTGSSIRAGSTVGISPAGTSGTLAESVGPVGLNLSNATSVVGLEEQQSSAGWSWQPDDGLFQRPTWCGAEYLRPKNFNVSMRPQHPCHYLDGVVFSAGLKHDMHAVLAQMHERRCGSRSYTK